MCQGGGLRVQQQSVMDLIAPAFLRRSHCVKYLEII